MICKVCGNTLNDGDRFCSKCGSRVLEADFFDSRNQEQDNEQGRSVSHEEFNWNLDGYPSDSSKKTEDIEFDWKSVNADNRNRIIKPEEIPAWRTVTETVPEAESEKDEPVSLEELFDDSGEQSDFEATEPTRQYTDSKTVKLDKFYTFNKKNEEFQALLDREYEKMQSGTSDMEDLDDFDENPVQEAEAVAEPEPEVLFTAEESAVEEPAAESVPEEKTFSFIDAEPGLIGVALAETPACIMADSSEEEKAEEKEAPQEAERKLTFEDVFRDDEDDEEGAHKKKGGVLRVLAVILCILIVLELVMIAVQYFAPDSALAQKFNEIYLYIVDRITSIV